MCKYTGINHQEKLTPQTSDTVHQLLTIKISSNGVIRALRENAEGR